MTVTREEAIAWRARWRAVHAHRTASAPTGERSPAERLRAVGRLRAFGMAANRARDGDDARVVRERFQALRERFGRDRHGA